MTCQTCQHVIPEFLDGTLDASREADVASHVLSCPACRAVLESERRRLKEWSRALAEAAARSQLPPQAVERFFKNMEALEKKRRAKGPGPETP